MKKLTSYFSLEAQKKSIGGSQKVEDSKNQGTSKKTTQEKEYSEKSLERLSQGHSQGQSQSQNHPQSQSQSQRNTPSIPQSKPKEISSNKDTKAHQEAKKSKLVDDSDQAYKKLEEQKKRNDNKQNAFNFDEGDDVFEAFKFSSSKQKEAKVQLAKSGSINESRYNQKMELELPYNNGDETDKTIELPDNEEIMIVEKKVIKIENIKKEKSPQRGSFQSKTPEKKTYTELFKKGKEEKIPDKKNDSVSPAPKGKSFAFRNKDKSTPKREIIAEGSGVFEKKGFVITGVMDSCSREELEDIIKSEGGKVVKSAPSKKTDFLVYGQKLEDGREYKQGRKYLKAVELKTKLLSEDEFEELLFNLTGKKINNYFTAKSSLPEIKPKLTIQAPKKDSNIMKGSSEHIDFDIESDAHDDKRKKEAPNKLTDENELWTEKFKPISLDEVLGNQKLIGDLKNWLKDWEDVVIRGQKKDIKFQVNKSSWGTGNENSKACLISGPPGIGKTTTARLILKETGYQIVEQNASDVRNKKSIEKNISGLTTNRALRFTKLEDDARESKQYGLLGFDKVALIMDEVDGMSSGDRGGIKAVIEQIKTTKIPIICICNDRMHTKIRSLLNYCYDLRFSRPTKNHIIDRMLAIINHEGFTADRQALDLLIESMGNDIRQILNYLQMWFKRSKELKYMDMKQKMYMNKKDETVMINNFDAASKLLNNFNRTNEKASNQFRQKLDLFFIDYDLIPLLIHENYLASVRKEDFVSSKNGNESLLVGSLEKLAQAAESIARGDIISKVIRNQGEWSLLPNLGLASAIYPCHLVAQNLPFPKFPEWLGKNSSTRKIQRELKELKISLGPIITGSRFAVKFDYAESLLKFILHYIKGSEKYGVESVLDILETYNLNPDLIKEHLCDVQFNPKKLDFFSGVPSNVKTQITRSYNTRHKSSIKAKKKGRTATLNDDEIGLGFEMEEISKADQISEEENNESETEIEVKIIERKKKAASKKGR